WSILRSHCRAGGSPSSVFGDSPLPAGIAAIPPPHDREVQTRIVSARDAPPQLGPRVEHLGGLRARLIHQAPRRLADDDRIAVALPCGVVALGPADAGEVLADAGRPVAAGGDIEQLGG